MGAPRKAVASGGGLLSQLRGFDGSQASSILRAQWPRLSRLPGGRRLFSRVVGLLAPYSGSIGAEVVELREGYARVALRDRRAVRNHLGSVHALALANLAEIAGNLALLYSAPADSRMILAGLSMEYLKKARGRLEAECHCPVPESSARREYRLEVPIRDGHGTTVAVGTLRSLLGPRR
jgi:uncharacterized protein (TIGR00369 family)